MSKKRPSNVFVRVRPDAPEGGHATSDDKLSVGKKLKGWGDANVELEDGNYTFPRKVLVPECTQEDMYMTMLPEFVEAFTRPGGINVLFFAYGQTGTGKTHTMFGPDPSLREQFHPDWGIFPRVCADVFETMSRRPSTSRFLVTASSCEFYNFQAYDLMNDHAFVFVSDDHVPKGLVSTELTRPGDVIPFLHTVRKNRTCRGTKMNGSASDHGGSSRSHCALILTLHQMDIVTNEYYKTTFHLVDLAGAERPASVGEARVDLFSALVDGWKLGKECSIGAQGAIINYELFSIGHEVLKATNQYKSGKVYKPATQLLTPTMQYMGACMDGSALLGMVVCLSQAPQCGWETWFSLKYGTDLAKIQAPANPQKPRNFLKVLGNAIKKAKELDTAANQCTAPKYIEKKQAAARDAIDFVRCLQLLAERAGIAMSDPDDSDVAPAQTSVATAGAPRTRSSSTANILATGALTAGGGGETRFKR